MGDIHLDALQLLDLRDHVRSAAGAIGEISAGAYVTSGMFHQSKGAAVDAMNGMLTQLVTCTDALQAVAFRLADYLNWVFVEFDEQDARLAQWLANYDVAPPNPARFPTSPEGLATDQGTLPDGTPAIWPIPHVNAPRTRTAPPTAG